jgi:uncharacterized protein YndB with AHSA1/START domain
MSEAGKLNVTTAGDREIVMTRDFDAPRALVFQALTRPDLLKRWLGVFGGNVLAVCEMDLRVGGAYRYLWRSPDGREMGMRGVIRELVPPERLVTHARFDESWYPGEEEGTVVLTERGGRTTLTMTVRYDSKEARDMVLRTPMEQGMAAGYDALEKLLATPAPAGATSVR